MSWESIQLVDVDPPAPATSPALPMIDITLFTYDREYDDHSAGLRSEDPVSHQWATVGQASSQLYRVLTLRWATISWFVGVWGALELPV